MNTIRELTDIELNEVAGGVDVIAIGSIHSTLNSAVVGTVANAASMAGGGRDNTNVAAGNEGTWIGNIL
jgi:hypothetical protein